MITTVLVYVLVAVAVIQVIYYLFFIPFLAHKEPKQKSEQLPVSVIVCSKNECENLKRLIPLLLKQSYSKFELVLINDASSDDSLEVMEQFSLKDKRIKIVNVENNEAFWGNKKYALTLGIKAAKYDHLLFTDADCIPASEDWISKMICAFSEKKSIVLGYGKYESKNFAFMNSLVRYETLLAAMQCFGYAKLGSPYMAVGRNLAYTKSEFFRVKGFINHMQIRSGDDDLFIQDAANSQNTTLCVDPLAFTISKGPESFLEWFRQKRRHISTAKHYKSGHKFFLGLFYISKLLFWVLAPIVLVIDPNLMTIISVSSYFLINILITSFSAKKLQELSLVPFLPFLELFLVLFQFTIFIANVDFKTYPLEVTNEILNHHIQQAKIGNQLSFNFLLDHFWADVYNYQLKRTKNDNDAEDITIQSFSKAFDRIETFDQQYKFKTWLITISKNIHIDMVRKSKSSINLENIKEGEKEAYEIVDEAPTPEDKIITEQNLAKLLRDIKKLKPKYQTVIQLRYFQELSYKEISEQINEPMNNVKVKLLRAKKLLSEIIRKS